MEQLEFLLSGRERIASDGFGDRLEKTQTQDPPSKTEDGAPSA